MGGALGKAQTATVHLTVTPVKAPNVERYVRLIEEILPALGHNTAAYNAAHVRRVLLRKVNHLSLGYAKTYVTALRARRHDGSE